MKKKPARETLADRVNSLIGPGRKFESAPDLAQAALSKGLIEKKDSFTRTINRIRNAEIDPMLNTLETIASSANVELTWLISEKGDVSIPVLEEAAAIIRAGGDQAHTIVQVLSALIPSSAEVTETQHARGFRTK